MVVDTKVILKVANDMDKVSTNILMVKNMMANGLIIKQMEKEFAHFQVVVDM